MDLAYLRHPSQRWPFSLHPIYTTEEIGEEWMTQNSKKTHADANAATATVAKNPTFAIFILSNNENVEN